MLAWRAHSITINDNAQYARDLESFAEANESRLSRVDIIYRLLYLTLSSDNSNGEPQCDIPLPYCRTSVQG
jgi:hypothetical protein